MIEESIPGGVTGFVPVRVQFAGRLNSSAFNTYMDDFYGK